MSQIEFSDKVVDSSCPTENRCHRCRKQIPFQRVLKKIEIPQLQFAQETMRSEIGRMTLEKTFQERHTHNQAVVRIVIETAGAWSIECLQYEIPDIILPASIKKAMRCRRKPSTANVGTTCRVKEISRAKSIWHEESNKNCESLIG